MRITRFATATLLAASLLLFVDLFLDWHHSGIELEGVLNIDAGSSGWNGWGIACGLTIVGLVAWEVMRFRGEALPGDLLVSAVLGVLVAGFALGAFLADTSVDVGPVSVQVTERQWPAYVGLVLGVTVAVAAVVRLLESVLEHPARPAPTV